MDLRRICLKNIHKQLIEAKVVKFASQSQNPQTLASSSIQFHLNLPHYETCNQEHGLPLLYHVCH
jgi:hypothetical protein